MEKRIYGQVRHALAVALMLGFGGGVSHAASVNLSGSSIPGGYGNLLNEIGSDGTTMKIRAFGYLNNVDQASTAQLNRYSAGLGVSNRNEGLNAGTGPHSTDNLGSRDVILIEFSQSVILDQATITAWRPDGSSGNADSDVTYWAGTGILDIPDDIDVGALGSGIYRSSGRIGQGDSRTFSFASEPAVDWLLIGARKVNKSKYENDGFKLKILNYNTATVVPVPAAAWLGMSGLSMLGFIRLRKKA